MNVPGYQSDAPKGDGVLENKQELLNIPASHLNPNLEHSPFQNVYVVINDNLIMGKDIRLRSKDIKKEIVGWQLSLPAPLVENIREQHSGTVMSINGNLFFYTIDNDGKVFMRGNFDGLDDEVVLNINPYLAELPLRFVPFSVPKPPK
jgi:hypothetical protein